MESEIKKSKKGKRHKKHSKKVGEDEETNEHPTEEPVQIELKSVEEGSKIKKLKKNKRKKVKDLREGDNTVVQEDNPVASAEDNKYSDDSDTEDKPKRKKKKKPMVAEPSSEKKGKKSIRQMKKEKFFQRQAEAQALSKEQLKLECLSYLSQWKHDKQNWKFMKVKQVWLYKNKFSSNMVPDASWPLLLEYFESAKGNIRTILLDDANKVIQGMDEWTESQNGKAENEESEELTGSSKPDDISYKRARDLIQCLQE